MARALADGFVVYAGLMIAFRIIHDIFAGLLYGPGVFLGGAALLGAFVFCEFYFSHD